jgi:hypothetical protein
MEKSTRHFELKLSYRSDNTSFTCDAVDVIMADNLVSLLSQFNVLIGSLHHRILEEEKIERRVIDDDIPF